MQSWGKQTHRKKNINDIIGLTNENDIEKLHYSLQNNLNLILSHLQTCTESLMKMLLLVNAGWNWSLRTTSIGTTRTWWWSRRGQWSSLSQSLESTSSFCPCDPSKGHPLSTHMRWVGAFALELYNFNCLCNFIHINFCYLWNLNWHIFQPSTI